MNAKLSLVVLSTECDNFRSIPIKNKLKDFAGIAVDDVRIGTAFEIPDLERTIIASTYDFIIDS